MIICDNEIYVKIFFIQSRTLENGVSPEQLCLLSPAPADLPDIATMCQCRENKNFYVHL